MLIGQFHHKKKKKIARGVKDAIESHPKKANFVIRLTGTNEEEGQKILEEAGIPYEISMEKAAQKAVEICNSLND